MEGQMGLAGQQGEAPSQPQSGSFAELQDQAAFALWAQDIAGARATIRAMKDFVARAERDLEKLIAWTKSST